MAQIDIEALKSDTKEFEKKHKGYSSLKEPEELNAYIFDAEKILEKYHDPEGEARDILGKFYNTLGCQVVVFGNDREHGIPYYHKAIELCPNSYDIHFDYFTTLEEIIENDRLRTPELVQDAIHSLQVCINCCDTPELKREHSVQIRYLELGSTYLIAKQPEKAIECAKKSLKAQKGESARELLKNARKQLGFFGRLRAWFNKWFNRRDS